MNNYTDLAIDLVYSYKRIKKLNVRKIVIKKKEEKIFNKRKGTYITIEFPKISKKLRKILSIELSKLIKKKILIVGLGNINSTPDSLGPKIVNKINLKDDIYLVSPSVKGLTGIETLDHIKGICKIIKPNMVIVIDCLCSSNINRINHTIQITDTGIIPGSGVGNNRKEISKKSLGIPVVALGVPTVVSASSIVNDCLNMIKNDKDIPLLDKFLEKNNIRRLSSDILGKEGYNLIVSPKEEDMVIDDLANLISGSLNDIL